MLAFPSLIAKAAENAGIKTPELDTDEEFDPEEFPHFALFCTAQLGRPMSPGAHWGNAKVIAKVPEEEIKTVTPKRLIELGWVE